MVFLLRLFPRAKEVVWMRRINSPWRARPACPNGNPAAHRRRAARMRLASIASGIPSGKLPDCSVGNFPWIANTRRCDFEDFFSDDIHLGIVTIKAEGAQRKLERLVQPLDLFRVQLVMI